MGVVAALVSSAG